MRCPITMVTTGVKKIVWFSTRFEGYAFVSMSSKHVICAIFVQLTRNTMITKRCFGGRCHTGELVPSIRFDGFKSQVKRVSTECYPREITTYSQERGPFPLVNIPLKKGTSISWTPGGKQACDTCYFQVPTDINGKTFLSSKFQPILTASML